MNTATETERSISRWIASAHSTPSAAWLEWEKGGMAMLPTGRAFDTVRISAEIIHATAQSGSPDVVGAYLSNILGGPVIHDAYDTSVWYYVLVPLGSCAHHDSPDAQLLTPEITWLGVPDVHRTARPGVYWLLPPRHPEDYCTPSGVDEVIRAGRQRIAEPAAAPAGPDLDGIERGCRALFDGPTDYAHDLDVATKSTERACGYLMVLIPILEDAAARMPSDAPARSRVLLGVTEAQRQLNVAREENNPARQYAHVLRLARCCLDQVRYLRELDAATAVPDRP
ncbi:DUF6415 family natural product biosynthesis protein [Streptomyces sp. NPDC059994]|uniref:DUF6415 family natural product biosynthesis protein n=1 Tax=Streptomyces sp. NPDC059994 TaxID=3347029 RepID=UPI00369E620B